MQKEEDVVSHKEEDICHGRSEVAKVVTSEDGQPEPVKSAE